MRYLKIAVLTEKGAGGDIDAGIKELERIDGIRADTDWYCRREDLLYGMRRVKYSIVVISLAGALGMEAAIGAREENSAVPIVWVSDEDAFALQSYRLHIKMFLVLPVTPQRICEALCRCMEDMPEKKTGTEEK
jgi:two-component SAPR family response regulator